ncbi:MAG TPA: hypothetical protein VJA21_09845 [Verrucomicrobiae bacterium]
MSKRLLPLVVLVLTAVVSSKPDQVQGQQTSAGQAATGGTARNFTFDSDQDLAGWTITGDVGIGRTKGHGGTAGALKVGRGAKALLKLRENDGSGQVEFWVYDDGTTPENPKTNRPGPRWGLVQNDGRVLAVGILYASYLGGDEGYTATANDGQSWFDQLFWLGVNRAPAGWHKWTFIFDTEKGLQLIHADQNGKPTRPPQFDNTKAGLKGFSAIAIWGDSGTEKGQAIWVDDISVTLGGPVKSVPQPRPTAPRVIGPNLWIPSDQTVPIYTLERTPATPKLDELPLKESVSQYGITWTFAKPTRVGQFVNGDWYVVGPVIIKSITPKPLYGEEIPEIELDHMDLERPLAQRVRNGFMLNPPAAMRVSYDSGVRNWFDPSLIQRLPVAMKPGDSLVSTISMPKGLVLKPMLWETVERGVDDSSPIRTAAVLTCVPEPLPPDAFRPAFCDRLGRMYLSRNLKRSLLPTAAGKNLPDVGLFVRFTQRPWVGTGFFGFESPVENMPQYGRDYARVVGQDALLLCTDVKPEKKEALLVDFVQVGIDLGGMIRSGHPGWEGFGGHGSGRKLPIVFAGLLLGDEQLASINKFFPQAHFSEDEQTAYGDAWTGAKVVFTGHRAIDEATGVARAGTGPYEHTPPSTWKEGREKLSESYRRCCTSAAWVAEALALRLMKAEQAWDHDAFFDYCDRWMYEDEIEALKKLEQDAKMKQPDWAQEGKTWEAFVNEMWAAHRTGPGMPPTDGWRKQHDDSYLKAAMERAQSSGK